jgi:hypothetical protein
MVEVMARNVSRQVSWNKKSRTLGYMVLNALHFGGICRIQVILVE